MRIPSLPSRRGGAAGGDDRDGVVVDIAPMKARHLPDVIAIDAAVYAEPWSRTLWLRELELDDRAYRVARPAGRSTVLGHAGVIVGAGEAHVTTVAVDPTHQGGGLGTRLMVALCAAAVGLGAEAMTLEVRVSNRRAQDLYRRFGFAPVGIRPGYYADGEDGVIMWLHELRGDQAMARLADVAATVAATTRFDIPEEVPA